MATVELSPRKAQKTLRDADLLQKLQELRRPNNWTNWYYLLRTWLSLAAVIGGTIWYLESSWYAELPLAFSVAVVFMAITAIGAGQHQLTGLAHEASHHILFEQRILNDLVSDWLCMFPMFSTTHHYRLQHMAHHQFVNDPDRDPDVSQLKTSGHWLRFPIEKAQFVLTLIRQLWVPNLIKYIRVRAQYNAMGTDKNPYLRKGTKSSRLPILFGIGYLAILAATLSTMVWLDNRVALVAAPLALWAGAMLFYAVIPARLFHQSRVHPVISARVMSLGRITFLTLLFSALAWTTAWTGRWAAGYFLLLWILPMVTSFSFFMVLRQLVQHGNGDRGWLTNTRIFFVHPIIRYCVFPMGQDFHLPHHMFATVPHYRLARLHSILLEYPEYRRQGTVVEGYFFPAHRPPTSPTVLDVLAENRAARGPSDVYIDNSVLELDEVDDKEEILEESAALAGSTRTASAGGEI